MAPQIAHKHHRGHGKLDPGLWGSCYQADIPFVYTIRRDQVDRVPPRALVAVLKNREKPGNSCAEWTNSGCVARQPGATTTLKPTSTFKRAVYDA